jgi:hypothetical protein
MSNGDINPSSQYVVSYNTDDFYCNKYDLVNRVFTLIDPTNLKDKPVKSFCNDRDKGFYRNKGCKDIKEVNSRDNMDKQICAVLNGICDNHDYYNKMKEVQTTHYASNGRYSDVTSFHDTEMLKSANLGIGILGLFLVIYKLY